MEVSDFVIKETVTNSGDKKYIIGKMEWKQPIGLLQLFGLKKIDKVFEPVNYELRTAGRYESFMPSTMLIYDSFEEAEIDLIKNIQKKHDCQIKSERIIEI